MKRNDRSSRRRGKESLAKLLATTAGTLLVASTSAHTADTALRTEAPAAPLLERARELRNALAAKPAETRTDAAPTQLAWWGNWHNGGYHPYWHNWPNWHNWHNWHNWGNW